jgi:lysophospholipase L1-like esterase
LSAYGSDGVHPTKEGYKVMVDVLKNTIPGIE